MTTGTSRESAQIYQFPTQRRLDRFGSGDQARATSGPIPLVVSKVVTGSGWYHEAAIQEAVGAGRR